MRGVQASVLLAVSLLASTLGATSAFAQFRISDDRGGQIGPYLEQFAMIRDSGSRVIIDGTCLSACTLVLGTVPKERICVTSRASLGFHAAWNPGPGGRTVYSDEGTQLLWDMYPTQIRNWIRHRGGLTPRMIYLRGRELASMYQTCPSGTQYASEARANPGSSNDGRPLYAARRKGM